MKLYNKSQHSLQHTEGAKTYNLPIEGVAEIPDEIAKKWLKIAGVQEYIGKADLAKAEKTNKVLEAENAKLLAEIEKLKADLAKKDGEETLDLDALKAEADARGIQYAPNISAKTLKAKIEALNEAL